MLALGINEAASRAGAALAADGRATVSSADRSTDTEGHHSEEQGEDGGPGEAIAVLAEAGILSIGAEGIAGFDGPGTISSQHVEVCVFRKDVHSRHQSSSQSLEEQSNHGVESGQESTKTSAKSQQASRDSNDGKEERDNEEDPSETREVVELVRADELSGDRSCRAKVPGRIEGESGHYCTAIGIVFPISAADSEIGPASRVAGIRDAVGAGLEEVNQIRGETDFCAGEDDKELQDDCAGEEEEAYEA